MFEKLKSTYSSILSFKSKSNHYDHRVKWFTTKNKKKRIKMFRRSSKRIKKTRQMTPHAMCRHMVRGKAAFKSTALCSKQREKEKVRQDDEGGGTAERHSDRVSEREISPL